MSNQPSHYNNQPSGPPPYYSPIGVTYQEQTEVSIRVSQQSWNPIPSSNPRPAQLPEFVWLAVPSPSIPFTIPQLFELNPHITNPRIIRFGVAEGERLGYMKCLNPNYVGPGGDVDGRSYEITSKAGPKRFWDQTRGVYQLQHRILERWEGEWA